jgi:hypothetical protein
MYRHLCSPTNGPTPAQQCQLEHICPWRFATDRQPAYLGPPAWSQRSSSRDLSSDSFEPSAKGFEFVSAPLFPPCSPSADADSKLSCFTGVAAISGWSVLFLGANAAGDAEMIVWMSCSVSSPSPNEIAKKALCSVPCEQDATLHGAGSTRLLQQDSVAHRTHLSGRRCA